MAHKGRIDEKLQDIAVLLAFHCVRNTVIEDYHAQGKLTDPEMKAFNKEVANKLYTLLQILTSPHYAKLRNTPEFKRLFYKPGYWDTPELDDDFLKAIEYVQH